MDRTYSRFGYASRRPSDNSSRFSSAGLWRYRERNRDYDLNRFDLRTGVRLKLVAVDFVRGSVSRLAADGDAIEILRFE
jgi:hypothetical protein